MSDNINVLPLYAVAYVGLVALFALCIIPRLIDCRRRRPVRKDRSRMTEVKNIDGIFAYSVQGRLSKSVKGVQAGIDLVVGINVDNGHLRAGPPGAKAELCTNITKKADRQAFAAAFKGTRVTVFSVDRTRLTQTEIDMGEAEVRRLMGMSSLPTSITLGP